MKWTFVAPLSSGEWVKNMEDVVSKKTRRSKSATYSPECSQLNIIVKWMAIELTSDKRLQRISIALQVRSRHCIVYIHHFSETDFRGAVVFLQVSEKLRTSYPRKQAVKWYSMQTRKSWQKFGSHEYNDENGSDLSRLVVLLYGRPYCTRPSPNIDRYHMWCWGIPFVDCDVVSDDNFCRNRGSMFESDERYFKAYWVLSSSAYYNLDHLYIYVWL
jgi:hypothetical protein